MCSPSLRSRRICRYWHELKRWRGTWERPTYLAPSRDPCTDQTRPTARTVRPMNVRTAQRLPRVSLAPPQRAYNRILRTGEGRSDAVWGALDALPAMSAPDGPPQRRRCRRAQDARAPRPAARTANGENLSHRPTDGLVRRSNRQTGRSRPERPGKATLHIGTRDWSNHCSAATLSIFESATRSVLLRSSPCTQGVMGMRTWSS
jgi:hypothetical protein